MTSKEALEMIVVDLVPKAKENNKEEIEQIEKDLEVLEAYRELFEKIKSQDLGLEYTGHELVHYYENIEDNKSKYED